MLVDITDCVLVLGFISTEQLCIQSLLASIKTDWRLSYWWRTV